MSVHIPIFLSSDDNYAPFVTTTIASICYNTKSFIDFYILDGGISVFNKHRIGMLKQQFANFSLEFIKINVAKAFNGFNMTVPHISISTYNRLLIPELKPDIDRALYTDVDVIALGDIAEMYEQSLGEYALGAVTRLYFKKYSIEQRLKNLLLNIDEAHSYFYAANLLIDCKNWRKNKISNKLLELCQKNKDMFALQDQDALNQYFVNNFQHIDNRFGFSSKDIDYCQNYEPQTYDHISQNLIIRHFESKFKPWNSTFVELWQRRVPMTHFNEFWFFASMTPFYAGLQQSFLAAQMTTLHPNSDTTRKAKQADKQPTRQMVTALRKIVSRNLQK